MLLLLGVALVAGFVTGISPCILPVLPVVVAGGATGESKRRPYLIIAGLVASFSFFTLLGGSLLSLLHLPQDFLNDAGIAILILLAIGLIIPWVGEQLEKPFAHLGSNRQISSANGFVLGVGLGLVAAPCAGPIFTAVTFAANHHRVGFQIALITLVVVCAPTLSRVGPSSQSPTIISTKSKPLGPRQPMPTQTTSSPGRQTAIATPCSRPAALVCSQRGDASAMPPFRATTIARAQRYDAPREWRRRFSRIISKPSGRPPVG